MWTVCFPLLPTSQQTWLSGLKGQSVAADVVAAAAVNLVAAAAAVRTKVLLLSFFLPLFPSG